MVKGGRITVLDIEGKSNDELMIIVTLKNKTQKN